MYTRSGHTVSQLDIAFYCGLAPTLDREFGVGREAIISKAFHAQQAGAPDADELTIALTEEERAELKTWHRPSDVDLGFGRVLRYEDSSKEWTFGLSEWGSFVPTSWSKKDARGRRRLEADGPIITSGIGDLCWVLEYDDRRWGYVADIKRGEWTSSADPYSLQLGALALAWADAQELDGVARGIFAATEGLWSWSSMLPMGPGSVEAGKLLERIRHAALNKSTVRGAHCQSCYARLHCPEYLMPVALADTALGPLTSELTAENAGQVLQLAEAMKAVAERALDQAKEFVRRGNVIADPVSGKRFLPVSCQGRESVDIKALRKDLGTTAEPYIKRGKGYDQFRWVNDK